MSEKPAIESAEVPFNNKMTTPLTSKGVANNIEDNDQADVPSLSTPQSQPLQAPAPVIASNTTHIASPTPVPSQPSLIRTELRTNTTATSSLSISSFLTISSITGSTQATTSVSITPQTRLQQEFRGGDNNNMIIGFSVTGGLIVLGFSIILITWCVRRRRHLWIGEDFNPDREAIDPLRGTLRRYGKFH
ncbi:uncharacterized protein VTP21DRAFT_8739 [Calcarisporiella thermophila]|uniref:uncharacterized protein n=1 Tax=Calcarisporiella thermophila TaxID=911321 RepID=UPI003742A1E1